MVVGLDALRQAEKANRMTLAAQLVELRLELHAKFKKLDHGRRRRVGDGHRAIRRRERTGSRRDSDLGRTSVIDELTHVEISLAKVAAFVTELEGADNGECLRGWEAALP